MNLTTFLSKHAKSPYLFTNSKTSGVAVDFAICGFMKIGKDNIISSKICQGCYSATLLNIYISARQKLINNGLRRALIANNPLIIKEDVDLFENDIKELRKLGIKRLRFYSLGDFSYRDMPYILAASKHITIDIISKALVLKMNESFLRQLNNQKNIWISLSFNFKFNNEFERIKEILYEIQSKNIQLNWTINYKNKEQTNDPRLKNVQVIHVTNKNKRNAINFGFKETQVCGMFDKLGNRTIKGVCDSCNNCHLSFIQHQKGKIAPLPSILIA